MDSSARDRSRRLVRAVGAEALSLALMLLHLAAAPAPGQAQQGALTPLAAEHIAEAEVRGQTADAWVLAEPNIHGVNDTDIAISDGGGGAPGYTESQVTIAGAPAGAVVTKVRYQLRVQHTYPGDLGLYISSMGSPSVTVWDREGGATDGGLDDDSENDDDIYLNRVDYTHFDGLPVNGTWRLEAYDYQSGHVGWIDYVEFWVYYCDPGPPPLQAVPPEGDHICGVLPFFDWSAVGGATGYQLQVDDNPDFSSPEIDATTTTDEYRHMDTLAPGSYQWRVRCCEACGCGNWSVAGHFVVDDVPVAPTLTAPADASHTCDTTPFLDWSDVSGATQYRIQVDDSASFSSPVVDTLVTVSNREVGPLTPGTYHWRVRAENDCGHSPWSAVWSFVIDPAPAAPTLLAPANGSHISDTTPSFDWSDVSAALVHTSGAIVYTWQLDDHPAFPSPIERTVSTSAYTLDSPLSTGTFYWRVKVETACGVSPWSQYWDFTIDAASHAPTNGTITPNSGGAPAGQIVYFTSTWSDPDGEGDLKACRLHIGRWAAPKSLIGNAVLLYQARTNKLLIRNDRGTRWWGGKPVGSNNVVQNSQVKVYCNLTTVTRTGNQIEVRWAVEFKPAFRGRTKMYLKARDMASLTSNLEKKGTWTVQ